MIVLRNHQKRAVDNIISAIRDGNGSTKGRVVIPTGGGKTFIEAAALEYQMKNNHFHRVHLVLAPRILLVNQLIDEFSKFSNFAYDVAAFHSGNYEADIEEMVKSGIMPAKVRVTTSKSQIHEALLDASFRGRDLVVFSTYHSCHRLDGIDFDTMIADESQFCVAEGFNNDVSNISARVKLFFTATEKHTASSLGRGLNNEYMYGPRLETVTPKELIDAGIIVPPRLHILHGSAADLEDQKAVTLDKVIEITKTQISLTEQMGFSKILFAMPGTEGVKIIEDNIQTLRSLFPEHDIFTITAKTGAKINGNPVNRDGEFMPSVKDCKSALIFHYDILSEGIDVDGITGIALLRSMNSQAKLLQTIGRAVRIYKAAPELKTCAWVSIPVINGDEDDLANLQHLMNGFRLGGHDISSEDIIITNTKHTSDESSMEDAYGKKSKVLIQQDLQDILHDIENGVYWQKVENNGVSITDQIMMMVSV